MSRLLGARSRRKWHFDYTPTGANGIEFVLIRFLASARETLIGGDVLEHP